MPQDEQRYQTRRHFVKGVGHVVEQVPLGAPLKSGQKVVPMPPAEPARPVVLSATDVPLELARKVVESAGLVVVPPNFLNPEQLEELGLDIVNDFATSELKDEVVLGVRGHDGGKLSAEEMIARVKQAASFEELNKLMDGEGRKTVIAAAEERAEQLKDQGAA